ncbi:MAG: hypothetical protein MI920_23120 [Kiloniellales bacterium]|nr:hypothetical protein [Kiloniellales bacterium]
MLTPDVRDALMRSLELATFSDHAVAEGDQGTGKAQESRTGTGSGGTGPRALARPMAWLHALFDPRLRWSSRWAQG